MNPAAASTVMGVARSAPALVVIVVVPLVVALGLAVALAVSRRDR